MREYTTSETLLANVPYMAMVLLGAATLAWGSGHSSWALTGAVSYGLYGIVGAFWIMAFVCPFCSFYGTRRCPCGYGAISAKIVRKGEHNCFSEKFKRHIPIIVPLWLIPVAYGGAALWFSFSWWLLALVSVFVVNSYVVLPVLSKKHCCSECPQKDECPWMKAGAKGV